MDAGDWISLLTCAGALGSFTFFVRAALRGGDEDHPFRPVWLVLLAGGTARPDPPNGADGGTRGGHPPPPVPPPTGSAARSHERMFRARAPASRGVEGSRVSEILCEGERATGSTGIRPVFDARFQITDPRFPLIPNQGYLPEPFTALETLGERTARRVLYSNAVELGSEEREKEKEVGEEVHDPNGYLARERIEELQREAERAYLVRQLRSARRRESTATGGRVRPLLQRVIYEVLAPLRIFKRKKRG